MKILLTILVIILAVSNAQAMGNKPDKNSTYKTNQDTKDDSGYDVSKKSKKTEPENSKIIFPKSKSTPNAIEPKLRDASDPAGAIPKTPTAPTKSIPTRNREEIYD